MRGLRIEDDSLVVSGWGCLLYAIPWAIGFGFLVYSLLLGVAWVIQTFIKGLGA